VRPELPVPVDRTQMPRSTLTVFRAACLASACRRTYRRERPGRHWHGMDKVVGGLGDVSLQTARDLL
jgi:hypothetical protein